MNLGEIFFGGAQAGHFCDLQTFVKYRDRLPIKGISLKVDDPAL